MKHWSQKNGPATRALLEAGRPLIELALSYDWTSIVDFGCGFGLHCEEFTRAGRRATGVDIAFQPEATAQAAKEGYALIASDWSHLPNRIWDAGYSFHSLEHTRDPIGTLHTWGAKLKPGAMFFVGVPIHKPDVACGHIAVGWSVGQLAYCMAVAGFDCRQGHFLRWGGTVYGAARRLNVMAIADVHGGWNEAADRLPDGLVWHDKLHFAGDVASINWPDSSSGPGRSD